MHQPIQLRDRQGRRKYLTASERESFFLATKSLAVRERTFCRTLYCTGCRISEALAIGPFAAEGKILTFRTLKQGEGWHQRLVPISPLLEADIHSLGEKPFPFSRTTGWRIIKKVMADAGISGPQACPKGLRHGFAFNCATEKAYINKIQAWMGHASPMTTMIYLDAVGAEERELISRTWNFAEENW